MTATQVWPEDVVARAKQLRREGLGSRRIWRTLYREGWTPLPSHYWIENHMTQEQWPVAGRAPVTAKDLATAAAENRLMVAQNPPPDAAWLVATKRCPVCLSVGTGETCEQGHQFKGEE